MKMKISEEMIAIKMCIKTLSMKVKRLENLNRQMKKQLTGDQINGKIKLPKKISRNFIPINESNSISTLRHMINRDD